MAYFNTASSKCLLEILDLLNEYQKEKNGYVTVNWFYQENDWDMLETGEDYILDTGMEINLISYE
jgi:hypothetical protein